MNKFDNYIVTLRVLKKNYLEKAEENIIKYVESDNDNDKDKYYEESYKCLGIAEGLQKAITLFQYW